jgi:hypothetical protein
VRSVGGDGTITTVAGGGVVPMSASVGEFAPDGTAATDLELGQIGGVAVDGGGRMYVSDGLNRVGATPHLARCHTSPERSSLAAISLIVTTVPVSIRREDREFGGPNAQKSSRSVDRGLLSDENIGRTRCYGDPR